MKRSALFVGVNRYEDPEINPLQFAESDATELYAFFKHRAGYDDVRNLLNPDSDALLDTASKMIADLSPGDLFVFFFAGHGVECEKRHLLLCPSVRHKRLRYFQHTVPVDLLKSETERQGVHRVFILDACRSDLLSGHRSVAAVGLLGVSTLRDITASKSARMDGGGFALLCACDEGQQSRELPDQQHGVFASSFLRASENAVSNGHALTLSESLLDTLRTELSRILGPDSDHQRPWLQISGKLPPLLVGKTAPAAAVPIPIPEPKTEPPSAKTQPERAMSASPKPANNEASVPAPSTTPAINPATLFSLGAFLAAGIASAMFELDSWMFAGVLLPVALLVSVLRPSAFESLIFPPVGALAYLMAFAFRYNAWGGVLPQIPLMGLMIAPHIVLGVHLSTKVKQGR